ncbi:MAG: hypothetical protein HY861_02130 [Chlamydiia bacterium]|nr:hypothetical protein [Chlamydiia bacterium]
MTVRSLSPSELPLPNPVTETGLSKKATPQGRKVSTTAPPVAAKVQNAWLKFQAGRAAIYLFSFCFCWLTVWFRLYSHFYHKSLHDGIKDAQIQKLKSSFDVIIGGHVGSTTKGAIALADQTIEFLSLSELRENILQCHKAIGCKQDPASATKLAHAVIAIREKIAKLHRGEFVWGGVEGLREEIAEVMKMQIYQDLENYPESHKPKDCFAINFLQVLAVKFVAVDGTAALTAYGKKCLESHNGKPFAEEEQFGPADLADQLSGCLQAASFSSDGWVRKMFWALAHPHLAVHSLKSVTQPLEYNASESNPSFTAYSYADSNGKEMRFYYGPGPTGDAIFEHGLLPAYKRFQIHELRFNHQDTHKKDDHARVQDAHRMAREHPEALRHAVVGFDKSRAVPAQFVGINDFFRQYSDSLVTGNAHRKIGGQKEDNGVCIPQDLLDDRQVRTALQFAESFCVQMDLHRQSALENRINAGGAEQARAAKAMQLIADTFLTLAMTYTSLDQISYEDMTRLFDEQLDQDLSSFYTSGACKQDVDRAVTENIMLRLFFRWATNPAPLTTQEVYEIAGAVFGRARLVDDRAIMKQRYAIMEDVLRFVGSAEDVHHAHQLLSGYREAILAQPQPEPPIEVQQGGGGWINNAMSRIWRMFF